MHLNRVVITGLGCVTPLGRGPQALVAGLNAGRSAVHRMEGWEQYHGLRSLVGAMMSSFIVTRSLIGKEAMARFIQERL